jgi:CheY-like chemotaxis protein
LEREIKILIVEDDVISSMYWSRCLRKLNYKIIHPVVSGERAIELVRTEHPDVILMDIQLGGKLDGIQTASAITSLCDARFIFITCYADEVFMKKIHSFKSAGLLLKPISINNIVSLINEYA